LNNFINFLLSSRKRLRETATCSPVWARSPSPPRKQKKIAIKRREEENETGRINVPKLTIGRVLTLDSDNLGRQRKRKKNESSSDSASSDSSSEESSSGTSSDSSDSESDSSSEGGRKHKRRKGASSKGKKSKKSRRSYKKASRDTFQEAEEADEHDDSLWVEKKAEAPAFVGPVPLPKVEVQGIINFEFNSNLI